MQAGSDVTGPSSSSGPGSSLAPEILGVFLLFLLRWKRCGASREGAVTRGAPSNLPPPNPVVFDPGNRGAFSLSEEELGALELRLNEHPRL